MCLLFIDRDIDEATMKFYPYPDELLLPPLQLRTMHVVQLLCSRKGCGRRVVLSFTPSYVSLPCVFRFWRGLRELSEFFARFNDRLWKEVQEGDSVGRFPVPFLT